MAPVDGSSRYRRPRHAAKRSPSWSVTLTKSEPLRLVLQSVSPLVRSIAATVPLIPTKIVSVRDAIGILRTYPRGFVPPTPLHAPSIAPPRLVRSVLAHRQWQAGDLEPLIHAADFSARADRPIRVDLAHAVRRVVTATAVGAGDAERLLEQNRAGRKLEDVVVSVRGIGGVPQAGRIRRVPEDLDHVAILGDDDDGVSLVGRVPDVARLVEGDAVGAFEGNML